MHVPDKPTGEVMALTHGAGGNCDSPLIVAIAEGLAAEGITVLRFNLAFREKGRPPSPATGPADRDSIRAALRALQPIAQGPVYLAGQSYGGRQASMVCAEDPGCAAALLLFSYPLHPPGKSAQLRTEHFPKLQTPTLIVHGARDPFATTAELEAARALIPAPTAIYELPKAGHDLLRGRFPLAPIAQALRGL